MTTKAEKDAMLARGEPFVVAAREVAKCTKPYRTDPEILLGCIIVSGTLDTAAVLRTEIMLGHQLEVSDADKAQHTAFRRVWQAPTDEERQAVLSWAERIAGASKGRPRRTSFVWNGPPS